MARLVYLLQGYFHASSDGASSCSSSASLWTWDTEKALYPKGLKQTLRAEHRRTPRGSSRRLRRSDLRNHKFAFVITNSSYCKSLAQANNVVPTIPRVVPHPLWHIATLLAPYTSRGEIQVIVWNKVLAEEAVVVPRQFNRQQRVHRHERPATRVSVHNFWFWNMGLLEDPAGNDEQVEGTKRLWWGNTATASLSDASNQAINESNNQALN